MLATTYVANPPSGRRKTRHATDDWDLDLARHCQGQVSRVMDATVVLMTVFLLVALLAIR